MDFRAVILDGTKSVVREWVISISTQVTKKNSPCAASLILRTREWETFPAELRRTAGRL